MKRNKWEKNKLYMKTVKNLLKEIFLIGFSNNSDSFKNGKFKITKDRNSITYKQKYHTEYELMEIIYEFLLDENLRTRFNIQSVKYDDHNRSDIIWLVFNINGSLLKVPMIVTFCTQYDNTLDLNLRINTFVTKEINK